MLNNNNSSTSYNNFSEIPLFPYKIVEVLLKDKTDTVEDFWKMLKYNTIDCLSKKNLTLKEKKSLIWNGDTEQNRFNIFFKPLIGDSLIEASDQTQFRLYRDTIVPTNQFKAIVTFRIDFITNEITSLVRKDGILMERTDLMETTFLNFMNGRDIDLGSGYLTFDRTLTRSCNSQLTINNSRTLFGRSLIMGLNYSIADVGGC